MKASGSLAAVEPNWYFALSIAAFGHVALGGLLVAQRAELPETLPDPVMIIELPAGAPPAQPTPNVAQEIVEPDIQPLPNMVTPRFEIPEVNAPTPPDPVTAPPPRRIQPVAQVVQPPSQAALAPAPSPQAPAPASATAEQGSGPGSDPRAQDDAADWYSLINAHLARNKRYPREARRDGVQGTPTVRFTVNRRGRVSDISISRTSGNSALDEAAISLLRRVSPLPAMPRTMGRDTITITLPIEYTLGRR